MECTSGMQCEPGSLQDHDYFASFSSRETWRCRIGELGGREPGGAIGSPWIRLTVALDVTYLYST